MTQGKKKILIVEEDHFLRKIYRHKLSQAGFEFIEAINGVEALDKIISEKPDLVLLDLMLPIKSGFDVLVEIKSRRDTKDISIIILSNLAQTEDIQRALALGACDYLIKSETGLSKVVEKVKEWLVKKPGK